MWRGKWVLGALMAAHVAFGVSGLAFEAPVGKLPEEDAVASPAPAPAWSAPSSARSVPPSFHNLSSAVDFIRAQRGLQGQGLPAAFYAPPGTPLEDPGEALFVTEAVGLYDASLAVIALVDAGRLDQAREILAVYAEGEYAGAPGQPGMELRAYPNKNNDGSFRPFDEETAYRFDFTNVYGDWSRWRDGWKFWGAHTGPNAWLAMAAARFIEAARRQGASESYVASALGLARNLSRAMRRLQDEAAEGGVRFGPQGVYHDPREPAPFDQLNTENNLSAYAAFRALARVTGDSDDAQAARRILNWLQRPGLFDPAGATFGLGRVWRRGRWEPQAGHPTDAGGTFAIDVLGAETLDRLWGPRTAFRMWRTLRRRAGRTAQFRAAGADQPLAGLDFTDAFPEAESLISPEWSGQGLFALKDLLAYYLHGAGKGRLAASEAASLRRDQQTMSAFLGSCANAYAVGPGIGGRRRGATGFGWSAPPAEVRALATLWAALALDGKANPAAEILEKGPPPG